MQLLKPDWVNHEGQPICSVDIHADGSRLATGGQGSDANSGRVVIWSMAPILADQDDSDSDSDNGRQLCRMDQHVNCVNCVRWSPANHKSYSSSSSAAGFLASAGDDKLIIVWELKSGGSGTGAKCGEVWRSVAVLRGHAGDVLDLSWSPTRPLLASCSVDNTVIVWRAGAGAWGDQLVRLRGHAGLVKGVAFDPVGKYLASQSDDRSLRVWRTSDWKQDACIRAPFRQCGHGTTHVLRCHWSPDGQHLAVTCVRFAPHLLTATAATTSDKKQEAVPHSCLALGSRDMAVSVWLTSLRRPLVVVHELFAASVMDLSWSRCGRHLAACSWDGSVAFMLFSHAELGGRPLQDDSMGAHMRHLYGRVASGHQEEEAEQEDQMLVVEDAHFLQVRAQMQQQQRAAIAVTKKEKQEEEVDKENKVEEKTVTPTDKQIETRLADGKRRITPLFLVSGSTSRGGAGGGGAAVCSGAPTTFGSSTQATSSIRIEKRVQPQPSEPGAVVAPVTAVTAPTPPKKKLQQQQVPILASLGRPRWLLPPGPKVAATVGARKPVAAVVAPPAAAQLLPALKMERGSSCSVRIGAPDSALVLQLHNRQHSALVRMSSSSPSAAAQEQQQQEEKTGGTLWQVVLPRGARVDALAAGERLVALATDQGLLHTYCPASGRPLALPLLVASQPGLAGVAALQVRGRHVMLVTADCRLWLWQLAADSRCSCLVKGDPLPPPSHPRASGSCSFGLSDSEPPLPLVTVGSGRASRTFVLDYTSTNCWALLLAPNHISSSSDLRLPGTSGRQRRRRRHRRPPGGPAAPAALQPLQVPVDVQREQQRVLAGGPAVGHAGPHRRPAGGLRGAAQRTRVPPLVPGAGAAAGAPGQRPPPQAASATPCWAAAVPSLTEATKKRRRPPRTGPRWWRSRGPSGARCSGTKCCP
ncbi:Protein HIRA [Halotydeus destructor]|nr:Protein HIRA [Halotydeus destructor]